MFHRKIGFLLMVLGVSYFLLVLPTTGMDYEVYQQAFDASYLSNSYPFFKTRSILTAEPFYLWYNSFWGVVLPFGFPVFLTVNFIICMGISILAFRKFQNYVLPIFWLMFLPVILPTIFYFSPRSSISFFLLLCGISLLFQRKYIYAGLLIFGGCMAHSQYLPIAFLIVITYIVLNRYPLKTKVYNNFILITSVFLFFLLRLMDQISSVITSALSFLPSIAIITSKMNYFEADAAATGFRVTSILSVFIYPYLAFQIKQKVFNQNENLFLKSTVSKQTEKMFIYLLFALMAYGAVINLAFLETPHVAGRLARLSDYIGMGLIMPLYFRSFINELAVKWIILVFCMLAPILYATLYLNVSWHIF